MIPVIAITTFGASQDARPLARTLVEERLVACVNIVPAVTSIYRWKDGVEEDGEQLLLMKTTRSNVDALRERLLSLHPYEVPEFVVVPVDSVSPAYGAWIAESTR